MKIFLKEYRSIILLSCFILLLHFINNAFTSYGYFRDELYYLVCTDHLGLGYVDHPPFAVYWLFLNREMFGDSIFSLRLFPALSHAAVILCAGVIAKKLGGRSFAQILSSVCTAFAPGLLGMFGIFSVNAFDIILWQVVILLMLKLQERERPTLWIWIGIAAGIGLFSKISMGWLVAGIGIGMIFTPMRKWYSTKHLWIGALIASTLFLPYIIWNIQHDLAHLEFARNASGSKYASLDPVSFIFGMIPHFNPIASPLLLIGFVALFRRKEYRFLFITVSIVLLILIANGHSKTEYFNSAAIVLFAAGSVQVETWLGSSRRVVGWVYLSLILIFGLIAAPIALDLLPVEGFKQYSQSLGISPSSNEGKKMGTLPQHFADRFGWEELARDVAKVMETLSENERSASVIYAGNYGEASAINVFREKYGLPEAISGHNSYWLWGSGTKELLVTIIIGGKKENHEQVFGSVEQAGFHIHPNAMPYESELSIFICRRMKYPIEAVWPDTKHYD